MMMTMIWILLSYRRSWNTNICLKLSWTWAAAESWCSKFENAFHSTPDSFQRLSLGFTFHISHLHLQQKVWKFFSLGLWSPDRLSLVFTRTIYSCGISLKMLFTWPLILPKIESFRPCQLFFALNLPRSHNLLHCFYSRVWWIFGYSNIFEYFPLRIFVRIIFISFFWYEYIRTFVRVKFDCTNIFVYSFVSVLECKNCLNIQIYLNILTIFNTNIHSDIHSCQICYTNIFGYSLV